MKKILFRKNPTKLAWPMSTKSDKNIFYSKRKKKYKITKAHDSQTSYLVTRLYI